MQIVKAGLGNTFILLTLIWIILNTTDAQKPRVFHDLDPRSNVDQCNFHSTLLDLLYIASRNVSSGSKCIMNHKVT